MDDSQVAVQLPQEWPHHLMFGAEVVPDRRTFPREQYTLDFSAMSGASFEQLCWWLLSKERRLVGCQRIGSSGAKVQGGIDLFAYDEQFPDQLHVFECKGGNTFNASALIETVERFLAGHWSKHARSFTLILARRTDPGSLADCWHQQRERLRREGVEADLWTSLQLTERIEKHPDVLKRFFPSARADAFGNQWAEQVGFVDLVSRSVFDPREPVARKAREFVERSGTMKDNISHEDGAAASLAGAFVKSGQHGRHWFYRGPWFSVSMFLPDQDSPRASAAFDFKQGDLQGITLTVGHEWLLQRFLFASGAPLSSRNRGFIVGKVADEDDRYLVDLPNCRMILDGDVTQALADVSDLMTEAMRDALEKLESAWSAIDFPFLQYAGWHRPVLASLPKEVWHEVERFTIEHDVVNGSTSWYMFDAQPGLLKPYHQEATEQFEAGYHGVISVVRDPEAFSSDRVLLLWSPDGGTHRPPSTSGWWSCEHSLQWLTDELLPEVKRHVMKREFGSRWSRFWRARDYESLSRYMDENFVAQDVREPALLHKGDWAVELLQAVQALQFYFVSAASGSVQPYVSQADLENLFTAISIAARYKRGSLHYVASSLNLGKHPEDHAELVDMLQQRIASGRIVANCAVVDYALRALHELLGDDDSCFGQAERDEVKRLIVSLASIRDDGVLVRRHSQY